MADDKLQRDGAMTEAPDLAPVAQNTSLRRLTIVLLAVTTLAVAFSYWLKFRASQEPQGGLQVGAPMPELQAAGWLNGSPPHSAELQGKVVFVNAWFTTCRNCHEQAPEIVALYKKYRDRGVVFIGLTYEPPEMLEYIKYTASKLKMTWPNGYGALDTLEAFEATGYPSYWLIGRDGRVVWNIDSQETLETAIDEALAAANVK